VVTAVVSDLRLPVRRQIAPLVAGLVIDLEVGAATLVGSGTFSQIIGSVYEMEMREGTGAGALLARFDPADAASLTAASWVSPATGETWTRNSGLLQQW
jgi:hypothetical protein